MFGSGGDASGGRDATELPEHADVAVSRCPDGPPEGSGWWLDRVERPEAGPVSWLGELAPSGLLLTELEQLPADLVEDDWDHVEVVAHWHRMEAYCAARKRLAAAALARRESMAAGLAALRDLRGGLGVASSEPNIAADELSLRLGVGTRAARRLVTSGQALGGVGLPVAEALVAGEIDAVKADLILEAVTDLPADSAIGVQERVLTRAGHLPSGSVRRELAAACAAVDPDDFEERARVAASGRRVCRPRVLPHGMAGLYAELPAYEATQLYRTLDAAARSAKNDGDSRTMDQLRADALTLMGTSALQTGWIGTPPQAGATETVTPAQPGPAGPAGRNSQRRGSRVQGRRRRRALAPPRPLPPPSGPNAPTASRTATVPHRHVPGWVPTGADLEPVSAGSHGSGGTGHSPHPGPMRIGTIGGRSAHVRVVVPLHALMGQPPPVGHPPDHGPGPQPLRRPESFGLHEPVDSLTSAGEHVPIRTGEPTVEYEHRATGEPAAGPEHGATNKPAVRHELGDTSKPAVRHDLGDTDKSALPHDCGDTTVQAAGYGRERTGLPTVESDPERLLPPAHLEGYGPIPDTVARAIAAGSVWQRLVLDPVSNTVRDLGATRYRPPAAMAELVRAEKPECVVPGCTVTADACDLDHHIPFPLGATATDNLDPLCRRHHLLTTHASWASADVSAVDAGTVAVSAGDQRDARLDATALRASRRARTWTTASGHTYAEDTDGALTPEGRRPTPPGRPVASSRGWAGVGPGAPPF